MAAALDPLPKPRLFIDTSELDIDPSTRIISLSDIHGDIDALIIALRDCAKVIKPRSNIPNIGDNRQDPELERLLNLNLLTIENMIEFDEHSDLGFDWIGESAHVVLIGDTIDPIRKEKTGKLTTANDPLSGRRNENDIYPQAEIKILKFLNRLDELAQNPEYNGRVIKLIGNHEISNFDSSNYLYPSLYTHDNTEPMPYIDSGIIKTISRHNYFNFDNPGFKLFMERGSGVFLRINNTIFIHGQIYNPSKRIFTFSFCNDFNKSINSTPLKPINIVQFTDSHIGSPQLWDRNYGDDLEIHKRINTPENKIFCEYIIRDIAYFMSDHPEINKTRNLTPQNMRLVIGHCPQMYSSWYNQINRTFTIHTQNGNTVEITDQPQTFQANPDNINNNHVFGITMECPEATEPHHKIYKVDVGVSRGFDQNNAYDNVNSHTQMKQYFLSRVPQILQFNGDDVRIIRSTLKNTRIHQVRHAFENKINAKITSGVLPADMSKENMTYGGYKEKYLKYKKKYMELKKLLNK
jgi:hypothetical protein